MEGKKVTCKKRIGKKRDASPDSTELRKTVPRNTHRLEDRETDGEGNFTEDNYGISSHAVNTTILRAEHQQYRRCSYDFQQ